MTLMIEATMELKGFSNLDQSRVTWSVTYTAPVAKIPITINFLLIAICRFQIWYDP